MSFIRNQQEKDIVQDIMSGNNVLIRGIKRIGKTSMLLALRAKFPGSVIVSPCDQALDGFKWELADAIRGQTEIEVDWQNNPIKEWVLKCDAPFLAIDEVTGLSEELCTYIAKIITENPKLRIALVIHHGKIDENKKFFPKLQQHYINAVSREEAKRLILKPLEQYPELKEFFSRYCLEEIQKCAGGIPYLIHAVCSEILDILSEHASFDEALKAIKALSYALSYGYNEKLMNRCAGMLNISLASSEKDSLLALASGKSISSKQAEPLIRIGVVRRKQGAPGYEINGRLLENFIRSSLHDYRLKL